MKKSIICCFLTFMLFISFGFSLSVSAESVIDAPGGSVSDLNGLFTALGGEEAAVLGDGYVMLRYGIRLREPIFLLTGDYVIVGAGCTITSDFSDCSIITVGGTEGEKATLCIGSSSENSEDAAIVLDGEGKNFNVSLITVYDGSRLEIYNGTVLTDTVSNGAGGAIYNEGYVAFYGGKIENCRSLGSGGTVFNKGELIFSGGTVTGCSAEFGGAVYNEGKMKLSGTQFGNCSAAKGGALFNTRDAELISSTLDLCNATDFGGAVYNSGNIKLSGGQISTAASGVRGGGLYNTGKAEISGTYFSDCKSDDGGTVYNIAELNITEGSLYNGEAGANGGNIYNSEDGSITYSGGSISYGKAVLGGGIYNLGKLSVQGGGFSLNKADFGQAIFNEGTLCISKFPYVDQKNDIFIVTDDEYSHAVNIESELKADTIARLTPGKKTESGYEVCYEKGVILIKGENVDKECGRFIAEEDGNTWYIDSEGKIAKHLPVYKHFWFYIVIIAIYALTVTVMTVIFGKLKKKKISE